MGRILSIRGRLGIFAAVLGLAAALALRVADAQALTVFAAASLKEALDEAGQRFERSGGRKARISYAASSALARQIENGAPADVFISADPDWADYLDRRRLLRPATRVNLLVNRLVLIAPSGSKVALDLKPGFALAEALGDGRLALADPDNVPAGKYARAALRTLGVWESVRSRVARAENVRAALVFVARGEAPLGIVYRSDAHVEPKVRMVGVFPLESHPPIVYPVAIVAASREPAAATFVDYLKSAEARAIFEKYGFGNLP